MPDIAEGYVHLRPYSLTGDLRLIGDTLLERAVATAKDIYGFPLEVEIVVEQGSAKVWIAAAATLYTIVATYPDFKKGAQELYDDAKRFCEEIIVAVDDRLNPSPREIYRTEKRTKFSGKIYRISKRIEKIKNNENILSKKIISDELAEIQDEIDKIASNLSKNEKAVLSKYIAPIGPRPDRRREGPRVAVRPRQLELVDEAQRGDTSSPKRVYRKRAFVQL